MAGPVMNETEIFAAAARREMDGAGSDGSEAGGEPAVANSGVEVLSSESAHGDVEQGASTGGILLSGVWNPISCVTQLINRLCWCNHEYPNMAEAEQSNRVRRNWIDC